MREAERPEPAAGADISIELRGGRVMRLAASMPVEQVARIAHAIEAAGEGAA